MKKILFLLLLCCPLGLLAQGFSNLPGFIFHSKEVSSDGDRTASNSYYFISITDKMLLHQVLTNKNELSDAQYYKIENPKVQYSKADEKTTYTFTAKSGVSGSSYRYTIVVYDDGTGNLTCEDTKYYGDFFQLKTFIQN